MKPIRVSWLGEMRFRAICKAIAILLLAGGTLAFAQTPAAEPSEDWREAFEAKIADAKSHMMASPAMALSTAGEAEALARRRPETESRSIALATSYWLQAEAMTRLNRADEAMPLIRDGMVLAEADGVATALDGNLLLALGRAAQTTGDVQTAFESYHDAHDVFSALGETRNQTMSLLGVGSIYHDAHDYERALEYFDRAEATGIDDPAIRLSIHNSRGIALSELGRYEAAVEEQRVALEVAEALDSPLLQIRILTNIASALYLGGDLDAAETATNEALSLTEGPGAPGWDPFVWGVKAQIAYERGNVADAKSLLSRVFEGADLAATPAPFGDFHEVAYKIHRDLGESDRALEHLEAFKRLDDQGRALAASANAALMAARFDFANQQVEIAQLQANQLAKDIQLAESAAHQRMLILLALSAISVVLLGSGSIAYVSIHKSRNEVRAANRKLLAANEDLAEANRAKSNFLAATSHEVRTPLNGILGMAEVMLMESKLDATNRQRVETVKSAGSTMLALIDDILDISKMEAGKMTLAKEPVDLQDLILETVNLWEAPAKAKNIKLIVDAGGCPETVISDEKRLRQILFNLISNAVKFTRGGDVRISAAVSLDAAGEWLELRVADTGIGVPEGEQHAIFDSFHQVETGAARRYGGTGLGLAITRNIARAMGGEVDVRSRVGEGSVFTVTVPLVRAGEESPAAEPVENAPQRKDTSQLDILIVEDNQVNRTVLEAMLQSSVHSLDFAEDGAVALEAVRRRRYDIVLMDKQMPNMDGLTATRTIRQLGSPAADVYIIAVTADAFEDSREEIMASGMDDFLAKPVSVKGLFEALATAIDRGLTHTPQTAACEISETRRAS